MSSSNGGGRLGPLVHFASNWISLLGIILVTTGAVAWLFTLPLQLSGGGGPYIALLTVVGLPLIFFLGLVLIPLGIRIRKRRELRAGIYPESFPEPRWQNPAFRNLLTFVLVATGLNVLIAGHMTNSAAEYMDSAEFCGTSCHIMEPEWTAYQVSPHSNVACAECHIGESAGSYIAAKLNGTKQLFQVLTGTETVPVPTPVHDLAQGELTCEKCHSEQDHGSLSREWTRFETDEANTATRTAVRLFIGGAENPTGAHGAHMSGGAFVEYASDPSRQQIAWVKYQSPDGEIREYATSAWSGPARDEFEVRRMDCVDCHNRAAHSFEDPGDALDRAMAAGEIDPSLPFIKREALAAIEADYPSREEAAEQIPARLASFYNDQRPQVARQQSDAIDRSADAALAIYERNIFPEWKVDWGLHPDHSGHENYPGCFRCHNSDLVRVDGPQTPIGDDCTSCHAIEAERQPVSAPAGAQLMLTSNSRMPASWDYDTALAAVSFNHAEHIDYAEGNCTSCHNALFRMGRGNLRYGGADGHRTAESAEASCAGCHVDGGSAFAASGNCQRCHTGLSAPRTVAAAAPAPAARELVGEVRYDTALGAALFDHSLHVELEGGNCGSCHNQLFPMAKAPLNYGGTDQHRAAESAEASCAGCHVAGGSAFAAEGNCARCHSGLGTPKPAPEIRADRELLATLEYDTKLGPAPFDHALHVELENGDCTSCHVKLFALEKGNLNYGGSDLHRTAESNQSSCAGCHVEGGSAFAADGNCLKCHTGLARLAPRDAEVPREIVYANALGDVTFSHQQHTLDEDGNCLACHNDIFPMDRGNLGYAGDYHREAEAAGESCAACHAPQKKAFGSLQNCTRCHEGLELDNDAVPPSVRRDKEAGFGPWALLLLLFFALPGTSRAQTDTAQGSGFIGRQRCAVCHQEVEANFTGNAHAHSAQRMAAGDVNLTCETCHGPGLQHVLALDPAQLVSYQQAQPEQINGACLNCHATDAAQAQRFASGHARHSVDCASCHQVHGEPARGHLTAPANQLCGSCHTDVEASFNRPFGHRLSDTGVGCVDCHQPHGTNTHGQLKQFAGTDTACVSCHADKRGPFPFEHAPVRLESCSSCHEPHGSVNPRLMTRHNVAQLCLECHTSDLATLGASPPAFHDLRTARFRSCTTCHTKTHGSFVNRDFLR